jgi:MFS transporter, ACS family, solute carrier family 17 (sodium-dependent inorganic phosphate cotransporter), other
MRVCLSVAIVDMTKNRTIEHFDGTLTSGPIFDWDTKQRGFALAAFFYGYICTQFIGGAISSKYGGSLVSRNQFYHHRSCIIVEKLKLSN